MNTPRFLLAFCLLATLPSLSLTVRAAERATIQGILLTASTARGQTDRRLAPYEPTLRRILRFESYRFIGEDAAALAVPGEGSLSLGNGHRLEIETERAEGRNVRLKVRWFGGGRTLMSTGLVLRPGVPAVLGGPSTGSKGEVYAVIVTER